VPTIVVSAWARREVGIAEVLRLAAPSDSSHALASSVIVGCQGEGDRRAQPSGLRPRRDEPVWVPTVFTKNRDPLLEADVARKFLAELMDHKGAARVAVGRALLGRRHADCGVGLDEELKGDGRVGRPPGAGPQWRAQFSR